ncbi:MAG: hypothetical protein ACD_49C00026G0016 [uncultured bacterium (gcode 4)]|uniref:Uncharacterized protein n=1 Tax=uncultured bacterium (gcode 4) TaxID=1234023 RepID=K2AY28_9BACT|nr:MAG: hypothetical protein ACD_49C00026G0016 [uncultured bacterium (gcode 4)]
MNNISTIIFDLSEVYLQWLKWVEFRLSNILWIDHEIINKSFFTPKLSLLFHWKITEDEYLLDLITLNNWNINNLVFKELIRENFIEIWETRSIIEELKNNWYKLWLLSVHAREWIKYCNDKYNYHCLFDYIVYSFDIWISKPDKESFLHIINLSKDNPKNILFIDDNPKNIESSIKLWMNWVLFENSIELKKILIEMKIL